MRNFPDKTVEKIETRVSCSVTSFRKSCRLCDNVEEYCRAGQPTDDNMALAHCILGVSMATDTHPEYVILRALPRQQWLRERASLPALLRYDYLLRPSTSKQWLANKKW